MRVSGAEVSRSGTSRCDAPWGRAMNTRSTPAAKAGSYVSNTMSG